MTSSYSNSVTDQPLNSSAALALAFESAANSQKDDTVKQEQVSTGTPPSTDATTTPSSTPDKTPDTRLEGLTLDEIKSHPTLGPMLQSEVDKAAARMLAGSRATVEREVRAKLEPEIRSALELEQAKRDFSTMDPDTLANELRDPKVALLYAKVNSTPPNSPSPITTPDPMVQVYATRISQVASRLNAVSDIPAELRAALDPKAYLEAHPDLDNETLLTNWSNEVDDAIVNAKVAKVSSKLSSEEQEARDLAAKVNGVSKSGGALMVSGSTAGLPVDIMDPSLNTTVGLAGAFARQAASSRR